MCDLLAIENLRGIFKARVAMSKSYSRNLEYLQATMEACREMFSPETLENQIQSIHTKSNLSLTPMASFP
jgi:hypothetical protein